MNWSLSKTNKFFVLLYSERLWFIFLDEIAFNNSLRIGRNVNYWNQNNSPCWTSQTNILPTPFAAMTLTCSIVKTTQFRLYFSPSKFDISDQTTFGLTSSVKCYYFRAHWIRFIFYLLKAMVFLGLCSRSSYCDSGILR